MNSWRGAWLVGNLYQDRSLQLIIAVTLSAVLLLGLLKTLRNISAPPCVVTVDDAEDYFDVPTYFKESVRDFSLGHLTQHLCFLRLLDKHFHSIIIFI